MHVACLRVQLSWSVSEMSITTKNNRQLIANNLLHSVQYSRQQPASAQLTHASDNRSSTSPYRQSLRRDSSSLNCLYDNHMSVWWPFRTTWVSRYQKGKMSGFKWGKQRWWGFGMADWQSHQLDHMQTICTSLQARRNVFVSGGYKFVRTLYNLVVKVVCWKFWHKPHLWFGVQVLDLGGYNVPPCPHSSETTASLQTDTNTSSLNLYRPDALSDAQPTVSKHWRTQVLAIDKVTLTESFTHTHGLV